VTNLLKLPAFSDKNSCHVVIESPRGSTVKFKYDPELLVMSLSRPLTAGLVYPCDWGFVPSTRASDGDPLDAFVMWDGAGYPGIVLICRPIGVLRVEQTNAKSRKRERNDRIAVLPVKAPRLEQVQSVFDLNLRIRLELERFFEAAVAFEGKDLEMLGWGGPKDAIALIRASQKSSRRSPPQ
jgi:inorganic pyrophosphatase